MGACDPTMAVLFFAAAAPRHVGCWSVMPSLPTGLEPEAVTLG